MACKRVNHFRINLSLIYTILCLSFLSLQVAAQRRPRRPEITRSPPQTNDPPALPDPNNLERGIYLHYVVDDSVNAAAAGGSWQILQQSVGVSAMHMQLMHDNKVIIFDRTDVGPSNLSLPHGKCLKVNGKGTEDCTAHTLVYDVPTNTFRPLFLETNVWCSSGSVHPDGTFVQTGGYALGAKKIRLFQPCFGKQDCDWIEYPQDLIQKRWYSSNQILPDGRIIIVGGSDAFSYEFFPKDPANPANLRLYDLPFLRETTDQPEPNNLYPFLHLLPNGNLFIFANQRSILLDYVNNRVIKEYPTIPGPEIRNYPCTGSSVLLPMKIRNDNLPPEAEVLICGGTVREAPLLAKNKKQFIEASQTCGRLKVTDPNPTWVMEQMPIPRTMPDMVILPTGDVLIVNGARHGSAGWEMGDDAVLNPVLYKPNEIDLRKKFEVMNPSTIPRMYHSTALLLPDGKVLISGSNPHRVNTFTGKYPTDMSMEAFSPDYIAPQKNHLRPIILSVGVKDNVLIYSAKFQINFYLKTFRGADQIQVVLAYPHFTTHSTEMNQRILVLPIEEVKPAEGLLRYAVTTQAPGSANVAPPGYYMLFLVNAGIPSRSVWVKVNNE